MQPDKRVVAERARGLPMCGRDRAHGRLRFELVARKCAERGVDREHLERPAFVQMPDLVRGDAMPAADDAGGQQEIDSRERRARSAAVRGRDQVRGPEDLAVIAALGMAFELELRDEFGGARVHVGGLSPRAAVR